MTQIESIKLALEAYELDQSIENHGALMQAVDDFLAGSRAQSEPDDTYDDPCPDCGKQLQVAKGGGVKCSCGYWFCF